MVVSWRKTSSAVSNRYKAQSKSVVAKVNRLQRQVALLKPELKCFQGSIANGNIADGAYTINYLSPVAQGSDKVNRIGNTIRPKWIHVKFAIADLATSISLTQFVHIALVLDKDSNGVVPTGSGSAESIYTSANTGTNLVQTNTNDRFKILWQRMVSDAGILQGVTGPYYEFKVKLRNLMTYRDTSGAQTGAGKNALYLTILPQGTGGSVTDVNGAFEIFFTDV